MWLSGRCLPCGRSAIRDTCVQLPETVLLLAVTAVSAHSSMLPGGFELLSIIDPAWVYSLTMPASDYVAWDPPRATNESAAGCTLSFDLGGIALIPDAADYRLAAPEYTSVQRSDMGAFTIFGLAAVVTIVPGPRRRRRYRTRHRRASRNDMCFAR
jgi:hypothetical protein